MAYVPSDSPRDSTRGKMHPANVWAILSGTEPGYPVLGTHDCDYEWLCTVWTLIRSPTLVCRLRRMALVETAWWKTTAARRPICVSALHHCFSDKFHQVSINVTVTSYITTNCLLMFMHIRLIGATIKFTYLLTADYYHNYRLLPFVRDYPGKPVPEG